MINSQENLRSVLALTFLVAVSWGMPGNANERPAEEERSLVPGSCTIFMASQGSTVLFGNNEDWMLPTTFYWVRLPADGDYGGVYLGHRSEEDIRSQGLDGIFAQGGMNEKGLAFDFAALPEWPMNSHPEYPAKGNIMMKIQQRCATVKEAVAMARVHDWGTTLRWQALLADATGDAVIMSAGVDGELAFNRKPADDGYLLTTNFNRANPKNTFPGSYPCWRYNRAIDLLKKIEGEEDLTAEYFRSILEAVHIESGVGNTEYSNVFDLRNGLVYLNHWHQYDETATISVAKEIARLAASRVDIDRVVAQPSPVPIKDLFSHETVQRAEREHEAYKNQESKPNWLQWGGPNRNFVVDNTGPLATKWSWWSGPKKLWRRELGFGYSGIVVDDGKLYTMYRKPETAKEEEFTIALDADTGKTLWELGYPSPLSEDPGKGWGGGGPNATPLIVANRLFVVGSRAMMRCLDKNTGKVLWSQNLGLKYGAPAPSRTGEGHCASPIAYKNLVIVSVGSKAPAAPAGNSLIAFDQATGRDVWTSLDFGHQHASPILVRIGNRDQLVLHAPPDVVGVDPNTGKVLWTSTLSADHATPSPVFDGKDSIFFIGVGDTPVTTLIRLTSVNDEIVPEVVWENGRLRINLGTPVLVDGQLYGATDHVFFSVDFKTGKPIWMERGFPRASSIYADGKLIILDENGQLTLATPGPEGLTIHAQHKIAERHSLTVPTLVSTTLYVRDRKQIMALDVGQ